MHRCAFPLMYQTSAEHFTDVASMRMIETIAANICCMLPAAHGEGTFVIPILYIRRWAPGLWGVGGAPGST